VRAFKLPVRVFFSASAAKNPKVRRKDDLCGEKISQCAENVYPGAEKMIPGRVQPLRAAKRWFRAP